MRSYAEVFLRHSVALLRPGDAGRWSPDRANEDFDGDDVRLFASQAREGDAILLRSGPSSIVAVGIVAGPYEYLDLFDDVNGWDLQHARRVRWLRLPESSELGPDEPGFRRRFGPVEHDETLDFVHRIFRNPPTAWQRRPLPPLPPGEPPLVDWPADLRDLAGELADLAWQYEDRDGFGDVPKEDELLLHGVGPLLRALGWSARQVAVKWRNVDVTLFLDLPRRPESVHLIFEAKRRGIGIEGALQQAKDYLADLGIVRDIVLTDGIRYRLYAADRDWTPVAYANFAQPKLPALDLLGRLRPPQKG